MKHLRTMVFLGVLGFAVPASAELSLTFADGRVTLAATDASLREILSEWARLGQTRIVGLEKVTGTPVTITLTNEPEKKALEILLRSLAGYMAAPRAAAITGASVYDRILLLPTSMASAAPPGPRPAAFQPPAPRQIFDPIAIANQEQAPEDAANPSGVPVFDPNVEQVNPATPMPVEPPNLAGPQPNPNQLGQFPVRPFQNPNDVSEPADPNAPDETEAPNLLTVPRPGVLPAPQSQQPQSQQPPRP